MPPAERARPLDAADGSGIRAAARPRPQPPGQPGDHRAQHDARRLFARATSPRSTSSSPIIARTLADYEQSLDDNAGSRQGRRPQERGDSFAAARSTSKSFSTSSARSTTRPCCTLFAFVLGVLLVARLDGAAAAGVDVAAVVHVRPAHASHCVARIYISGRPPITNLYSTAIFIGWACVLLGAGVRIDLPPRAWATSWPR